MIIGDKINTSVFTYSPQLKTFVAELSDLHVRSCHPFSQLYNDAADQGFVLVSHKTGREQPVFLHCEEHDDEGEITSWVFKFVALQMYEYRVVVIND